MIEQAALLTRLVACGLDPSGIVIRYEAELQSEVISITASAGMSRTMFECIHEAARGSFVEISDQSLSAQYSAFRERKAALWMRGQARDWLKARGKYEKAPRLQMDQDVRLWAQAVERFCGYKEGDAITFLDAKSLTINRGALKLPFDEKLECLFNVIWLSDLAASGVSLGFVGNEAVQR